jgi:putative hydrolase of HD superfamily
MTNMDIDAIVDNERFRKQISFLIEIDKVKNIIRKTRNFDNKKFENDAEHAWHLCMFAIVLSEYANEKLDIVKILKMVLIHDLVEIDAGDTLVYAVNPVEKGKKENECAERLFGGLPDDQYIEFMRIWEEFEAHITPESKFAHAIDRLEPVMQNYIDNGYTWKQHSITADKVYSVNRKIQDGSKYLWVFAKRIIDESVDKGNLYKE